MRNLKHTAWVSFFGFMLLGGCSSGSPAGNATGMPGINPEPGGDPGVGGQGPGGPQGNPDNPPLVPGASAEIGTVAIRNPKDRALSRLTNAQFVQSAAALMGDAALVGAAETLTRVGGESEGHGAFRNAGYAQDGTYPPFKAYDSAATQIVEQVTDWPAFHQRWGACTANDCIATFIRSFGEAAFRRPLSDEDVAAFDPILTASATAALTYDETVMLIVRATLQSPDFLYLFADEQLNDFQLASRLSYFVTDGPPDAELYAAAKAGLLHTPSELEKQADRLLNQGLTRFAAAFGYDYLNLPAARQRDLASKDKATVEELISSAVMSFASIAEQGLPVSSILTLNKFVTNNATSTWITGQAAAGDTIDPVPQYPFMGLLTHPATLMAISNAVLGSTVSRGAFIAGHLLCVPPAPAPPPGVQAVDLSALLPANPTARDLGEARMADARCAGCHAQFESYSFALNKWGGDGQFKDDPVLKDNGPVTTGLGQIEFEGFADFLPKLANSTQFNMCVADHVVRYGLQHTEYPAELTAQVLNDAVAMSPTITFRSLVKALVLQTNFTTR